MSQIIAPILFVVTAIGLYFSYISPAYDTLGALRIQEERLDKAFTDYKTLKEQKEELGYKYKEFSAQNLERLQQLLPDKVDVTKFITDINTFATIYGLNVESFNFDDMYNESASRGSARNVVQSDDDILGRAVIGVTVQGPYQEFKSFLRDLESNLTLFDVTSLSIDIKDPGQYEEKGGPTYTLLVQTYWLR